MNKIKRISILFVLLLTLVLYSSITVVSEEPYEVGPYEMGRIQIDDAEGGVGGEMYVNITMESGGSPIGDTAITMIFDPSMLEFVRGTNASTDYGVVTVAAVGDGTVTSLDYYIVFRGLAEGVSHLTITSFMTWTHVGDALHADFNQGTITVGPEGTEGTGPRDGADDGTDFDGAPTGVSGQFTIQATSFTIFDHFSDAMIPTGFVREQFDVEGSLHNGIRHTASNQVFMFMETAGQDPILAILNQDNQGSGVFDAAELRDQGGDRFVIILDGRDTVPTPANFTPTIYTIAGTNFHVWQSVEMPEFYLVYALSSAGHMGLFQFDTLDESFQRFMGPIVEADEDDPEDDQEPTGILGRIAGIMQDNIIVGLIAVLVIIFLLLIIIIVLSIKVQRRNNELDELYADGQGYYGDDDYDDDDQDYYQDDEYEDDDYEYEDDRYHDDRYDDEVGYDDEYEGEVGYDEDDEYDYDDDDGDDEDKRRKDDFNIDFVDL
jgi:hypothetical protein